MHPGVWIGDNFENAERRVLILGESHYDTSKKKQCRKSDFHDKGRY